MTYQRIVFKLGTSTLTAGTPNLSYPGLIDITRQVTSLLAQGKEVVLVSSGAMAVGKEILNFPELPRYIPAKQMLAAIGQPRLMAVYTQIFQMYGAKVAQVLLTKSDLTDRRRYLNVRSTLEALLAQHVVPIINENDTVAVDEIKFGDNDNLSALVANLVEADLLVLLTDQPGLFTGDPRVDTGAKLIRQVTTPDIPPELWSAAGGTNSGLGTGGMVTKLHAADLARRSGTTVIIAEGRSPDILLKVSAGEPAGTIFHPVTTTLESRKRFLLSGIRASSGAIKIDAGAVRSLHQGHSLLPVGVVSIEGSFKRGDTVRVLDSSGKQVAAGLANYSARDMARLCGHQSSEIEELLGVTYGDEVIHRNNMMVL